MQDCVPYRFFWYIIGHTFTQGDSERYLVHFTFIDQEETHFSTFGFQGEVTIFFLSQVSKDEHGTVDE